MRIVSVGGGPGGLYAAILLKKADPSREITVLERNRPGDTYGFGVVFSDATLDALRDADLPTWEAITDSFVHWDDIDIHYRDEVITSTGHGFSGLSRKRLLTILSDRCRELDVDLRFGIEIEEGHVDGFRDADLVLGADGLHSVVRDRYREEFGPSIDIRPNKFVWMGTSKPFPPFTFYFVETEHGLWRVHAYQYAEDRSTFIVETRAETLEAAGLEEEDEDQAVAFCEELFAEQLDGHPLRKNKSIWRNFPTVKNERWHHENVVLIGDAAHTAHFSVGSGTKMAMEDAIALTAALDRAKERSGRGSAGMGEGAAGRHEAGRIEGIEGALTAFEEERKPEVESLQRAAQASLSWFENTELFMDSDPIQFAFNLLTRSLRITHEDLRIRDPGLVERVDRWFAERAAEQSGAEAPLVGEPRDWREEFREGRSAAERGRVGEPAGSGDGGKPSGAETGNPHPVALEDGAGETDEAVDPEERSRSSRPFGFTDLPVAPPPMFTPFRLRDMLLMNRVMVSPMCQYLAEDGTPDDWHLVHLGSRAVGGAGLVFTEMTDVSRRGRISPGCAGIYKPEHVEAWSRIVDFVHENSYAKIGMQLGHSGRKGSTKLAWEGMDEPLEEDGWPIMAASPIPYFPHSPVPREMDRDDMDLVRDRFVRAAEYAEAAGFDIIELHFAHGYLLASFVSPLTNERDDEYGGPLENRMRFPLEVFDAVRAVWPEEKPMSVRISAVDWAEGGTDLDDSVEAARMLKAHDCDIVDVSAGQTVPDASPSYGRQFQTPFSDRIRNEVGIPTIAVGNISSYMDVNTILAAGRADICAMARAHLWAPYWTRNAAHKLDYDLPWPDPYSTLDDYTPRFE